MKKLISLIVILLFSSMTAQSAFLLLLHQKMWERRNINIMILRLTNMKEGKDDASFTTYTNWYKTQHDGKVYSPNVDTWLAAQREALGVEMEEDTTSYNYTIYDLEKAINCYKEGDFLTSLPLLSKLADEGNTDARYYLACCYYYGQGTEKDYSKAVDLFKQNKGVLLTDAYSFFLLSRCFRYGKGTTANYEKADSLVIEAACRGLNEAIELLQIEKEMSRNDVLDWLISILNERMEKRGEKTIEDIRKEKESIEKELKDAIEDSAPKFGLG